MTWGLETNLKGPPGDPGGPPGPEGPMGPDSILALHRMLASTLPPA